MQNPTRTDAVNGSLALAGPQVDGGQYAPRSGGSGKGDIFYNAKWQINANALYQLPYGIRCRRQSVRPPGLRAPVVPAVERRCRRSRLRVLATPDVDDTRYPNLWDLDLRVAKDIKIAGPPVFNMAADVFNVMNSATELGRTRRLNSAAFGQLNDILSPRILRASRLGSNSDSATQLTRFLTRPGDRLPGAFLFLRIESLGMSKKARFAAASVAVAAFVAAGAWWWIGIRNAGHHPNLLLITIDTLRADHVGAYGATSGATPALDALAASGVRFDQVQTAVPLTGPSHATILTGQYPPAHGVRGNVVFTLGSKYPTLATRVEGAGLSDRARSSVRTRSRRRSASARASTPSTKTSTRPVAGEPGAERRANEVADAALRWLESSAGAAGVARPSVLCVAAFLRPACAVLAAGAVSRSVRRPSVRRRNRVHRLAGWPRARVAALVGPRRRHGRRAARRSRRRARRSPRADARCPGLSVDDAGAVDHERPRASRRARRAAARSDD